MYSLFFSHVENICKYISKNLICAKNLYLANGQTGQQDVFPLFLSCGKYLQIYFQKSYMCKKLIFGQWPNWPSGCIPSFSLMWKIFANIFPKILYVQKTYIWPMAKLAIRMYSLFFSHVENICKYISKNLIC